MKGGSKAVRGMHQSQRSTHTINDTKDVHSVVHPYDEGENSQTHILSYLCCNDRSSWTSYPYLLLVILTKYNR